MAAKYRIEHQPSTKTMAIRFRAPAGDLPAQFPRMYGAIAAYLGDLGEAPAGPPYARYFNMDMSDLDVEAGMPVARELPQKGEVIASELPEAQTATCLHVGPYAAVEQTYNGLMAWLSEQGLTVAGAPYEFYLNAPDEVPEAELQTRVVIPVKEARET